MTVKKYTNTSEIKFKKSLVGITKIHFVFVGLVIAQTILYHASQVITPEFVLKRWIAASLLLITVGIIWYIAKIQAGSLNLLKSLLIVLITSDIIFASFSVYMTRGMASREVFLYILPIVMAGLLLSRVALFATAIFCIAAYSLTAISYFVNYFNEGYSAELYGEIGFYSAMFLIVAGLLTTILHAKD